MIDHHQLSNFIWQIADLLRGPYRPPQYERVMLPLTVLRRFDCVLAPTKPQVLARAQLGKPYVYGGGHARGFLDRGYDCSGTVSFALNGGGLLDSPLDSGSFMRWGDAGPGEWVTVYTNPGRGGAGPGHECPGAGYALRSLGASCAGCARGARVALGTLRPGCPG